MWLKESVAAHLLALQGYLLGYQASISTSTYCSSPDVSLSETWQVLGPFQIGTREVTWGADPLEIRGGFHTLEYDATEDYSSSLSPNATVKWSTVDAGAFSCDASSTSLGLVVRYPNIDWSFMQDVYGWTALQYQAWARGSIRVTGKDPLTIVLYTDHVLEFFVDDQHFFGGDYYAYRRAPVVLHLEPGAHRLDVRLVRDVRAMGGIGDSSISVAIKAELSSIEILHSLLLPDLVDGNLAGSHGSFMLRNDALVDLEVIKVSSNNALLAISLVQSQRAVTVVPGQTRPIAVDLNCVGQCPDFVQLSVQYRYGQDSITRHIQSKLQEISRRRINEPHKITFMHPGGIVSYAILRAPPLDPAVCPVAASARLPMLLQLHGAGLDAEAPLVAHALDSLPDLCAWVIFPTGVTPWSGDDWHQWGFADVEAAVASLDGWIRLTSWSGPKPDTQRWLVSGHSNGGQGTWYTMTHRPDKVFAAAPVSGYSSIQNYVPYHLWQPMEPSVRAILDGALNSYSHELLLPNTQGMSIFQEHGTADDNVPAYHSRLLRHLLGQAGANSTYLELPDKPHWFDGIMTTTALSAFYRHEIAHVPALAKAIQNFSLVIANPGDSGPKHGISVLLLDNPGQLGKVGVKTHGNECLVRTSNVLELELPSYFSKCVRIEIDGHEIDPFGFDKPATLRRHEGKTWQIQQQMAISSAGRIRTRHQSGAMDAILRTAGTFHILTESHQATRSAALQVSRNLCQYFAADTEIIDTAVEDEASEANSLRILMGGKTRISLLKGCPEAFPISISSHSGILIRDHGGRERLYEADKGLTAIFLRPKAADALELVVWGADERGLRIAARLVPMLTGVGQPDFVIADEDMLWKGAGGALAMGFFDAYWNVSRSSFFT